MLKQHHWNYIFSKSLKKASAHPKQITANISLIAQVKLIPSIQDWCK